MTKKPPPLPYGDAPPPVEPPPRIGPNGCPMPKGRKRGSRNKITLTLKQAILLAAEKAGDKIADIAEEKGEEIEGGLEGYLTLVAATDVKSFCTLLGKVLPMEITGSGGGALEVMFRTVYEGAAKPPGPERGHG